jgi:hypothetical protein
MAEIPAFSDAVLCFEFRRAGERARVHSDFLAAAFRKLSGVRTLPGVLRRRDADQASEERRDEITGWK